MPEFTSVICVNTARPKGCISYVKVDDMTPLPVIAKWCGGYVERNTEGVMIVIWNNPPILDPYGCTQFAGPGDYIITEGGGVHLKVSAKEFERLYEPIEVPNANNELSSSDT